MTDENKSKPTFTEEMEVAGSELIAKVTAAVEEGKVSRVKIKAEDGDVYLDMPLPLGAVTGGAVLIAAPWLAILGVIAAMVAKVKIEIIRVEQAQSKTDEAPQDKAA
jgi:hypothetical protein